jgi:hypothetical protein
LHLSIYKLVYVILYIPINPSYTIPIIGLDDVAEIIYFFAFAISINSTIAFILYGTNIFISSPSKSALYGVVAATFNLNVYKSGLSKTTIECAIIDYL